MLRILLQLGKAVTAHSAQSTYREYSEANVVMCFCMLVANVASDHPWVSASDHPLDFSLDLDSGISRTLETVPITLSSISLLPSIGLG